MGTVSIEKLENLYWLGRYMERVYTTARKFNRIFDEMIEAPQGTYRTYCSRLNIPDIYESNEQFVDSYLFCRQNPDSLYANMIRAYDNAIVMRDELSSYVMSYVQLAVNIFEMTSATDAPLLELQAVEDYILAFWGCVDDYVDNEDLRNIMKCGKYVERLDLYIRLKYHTREIRHECGKLERRIRRTSLDYNAESLGKLEQLIDTKTDWEDGYQEALNYLGQVIIA